MLRKNTDLIFFFYYPSIPEKQLRTRVCYTLFAAAVIQHAKSRAVKVFP